MNIKEIEKLLKNDLEGLLVYCSETFEAINIISSKLKNREISNPHQCEEVIQELNGLFGFLNPIKYMASYQKTYIQETSYMNIRSEMEKEGKKFVSAPTERESSLIASDCRKVRNILNAYVEVCKTQIQSCQSLLRSMNEEKTVN